MNHHHSSSEQTGQAGAACLTALRAGLCRLAIVRPLDFSDETPAPETEGDETLEDTVQDEREYVRSRLREELERDPTEEEIDDWLRRHTEGY